MTARHAVFLDRDNTITYDPGYLSDPSLLYLLPGAAEGLRLLQAHGLPLILISNQAGVGRGYFSEDVFHAVHNRFVDVLAEANIQLSGFYYCLHAPDAGCPCRKPEPGMLFQAAAEHHLDLVASFMIGDKPSDVEAGRRAGCQTILLRNAPTLDRFADIICPDLHAAAKWILSSEGSTMNDER